MEATTIFRPDSRLLTIKEAAELLRVHRVTISRWIKTGKVIPSYYVARHPRFDVNDLLRQTRNM